MTALIAPPADSPETKIRAGSRPWPLTARATICRTDSASPWSRPVSPDWNQEKHEAELLAAFCSGSTSANFARSANLRQPELAR
jgi:hypothetical protein